MWCVIEPDELFHHGIRGQKWGVRRFQNPDGTLTADGRRHFSYDIKGAKSAYKQSKKDLHQTKRTKYSSKSDKKEAVFQARLNKFIKKDDIGIERAKKKLDGKKVSKSRAKKEAALKEGFGVADAAAAVLVRKQQTERRKALAIGFLTGRVTAQPTYVIM